jgi:hypothetical protein
MNSDLHRFLADTLPANGTPSTPPAADLRAYLRVGGTEHAASVDRVMGPHFIVSHPGVTLERSARLVLSMIIGESGIRLDAPVEVVRTEESGGMSTLKLRGRPLVMRRRIVHDRKLAEALGADPGRAGDDNVPMVA